MSKKYLFALVPLVLIAVALAGYKLLILDRNKSELDERWVNSNEDSTEIIDHSNWQAILDDYLVADTDSGVNLFDYGGLLDDGREALDEYVSSLTASDPLLFSRSEQKAFWINLYNAATVALILDNYPLTSITNVKGEVGSFGPWDNDAVTVNGINLSLNDIEHRIIRPLYNDYRIHFAVNCASIGCPNLATEAFTAANMDQQLDAAAAEYLNHPRGLQLESDQLQLSSLFKWYAADFGTNQQEVLDTLGRHINTDVKSALSQYNGSPGYEYDWGLNGYCSIDNECGI